MPDMLQAALEYAEHGYAVIPVRRSNKVPYIEEWQKIYPNPDLVRRWWSQWPDANIGIVCGQNSGGLVAIDIDIKKGHHGDASLNYFQALHGEFPSTVTARTGTGGYHYYYRIHGYRQKREAILDGIDSRADRSFAIVPPSINADGNPYYWEHDISLVDEEELAEANDSVIALLNHYDKKDPGSSEPYKVSEKIREGERTSALVSLLGKLVDIGLDPEEVRPMVQLVNEKRCTIPLTDEELENDVFPAFTRGWTSRHPFTEDLSDVRVMPPIVNMEDISKNPPQLAPVLIEGVLRQGHKMIISAPSKAGKSFALVELALAIAGGYVWMGSKCTQGRVLYINMEIDDPSFYYRVKVVKDEMEKLVENHIENIDVWGLRGFSMPLSQLAPMVIEQAKQNYSAIIIDPLYKVMDGDENSNSDVSKMVAQFDRIARETGAAVIYAHHFAKGIGGDRSAIDRGAGAGTFARDPDAILTMVQLDIADPADPRRSAWRMEYVLREFPVKEPVSFWWTYPVHEENDELDGVEVETSATRAEKSRDKARKEKRKQQIDDTHAAVREIIGTDGTFTANDFLEAYSQYEEVSLPTAVKRLRQAGYVDDKVQGQPSRWRHLKSRNFKV